MAIINYIKDNSYIIAVAYLLIINLLAYILYGIDKRRARRGKYRIPESTLLWMARLGGGIGSWLGIRVFHHKTKHTRFIIAVPFWTILWLAAIVYAGMKYYNLPWLN